MGYKPIFSFIKPTFHWTTKSFPFSISFISYMLLDNISLEGGGGGGGLL